MIIDSLENAGKYLGLHKNFAKAFDFIQQQNLSELEPGKFEIEGKEVHASISAKEGLKVEEAKFEAHNSYIDIQVCISNKETMGWKPRQQCVAPKGEFNTEKDVIFYGDQPDTYFELAFGQFAIFYPEDVHAPMIGEGVIKKLVIKVKL